MKTAPIVTAVLILQHAAYCASAGPADVGQCCPLPQPVDPWALDLNSVLATITTVTTSAIAGATVVYAISLDRTLRQIAAELSRNHGLQPA
ncbi:hypothetical protein W97_08778 [Coniosporium apollinis CBS 100218]|uniref:Hydrophobin n=1 Tax=Coniosporium apollinis (strain CBS 100218) TaxID=1168221 RepID=R7Z5Y4_CONA1|nr:uncharacterized protein W97_08778 [Coniosporium apollinis CBS 100218]EON69518.1 hypothetical protein W97_08778 [Coniosporium apollinis CBS 100218]